MPNIFNRALRYGTDQIEDFTLKVMLVTSGYAFDPDDDFVVDTVPASNELQDASYSRQTITNAADAIDDTNDRVTMDCDNVTFTSLAGGEEIGGIVIYREVTNDSDSELLLYQQISPTRSTDGEDLRLIVNPIGLIIVQEGDITLASEDIVERGSGNMSAGSLSVVFAEARSSTAYNPTVTTTANEIVWVDDASKTVNGFTILSSNPTSTAKVYWDISE